MLNISYNIDVICNVSGIAGSCVLNIMLNICYNIDEICNVSGIAGTLAWQAARTMDIDHPPTQHQEHHTQFRLRENNQQISVWILHDKLGALMALQMYILGCCFFVRMFGLQKPFDYIFTRVLVQRMQMTRNAYILPSSKPPLINFP